VGIDSAALGIPEVVLIGHYHYSRSRRPLQLHLHKEAFEVSVLKSGTQTYVIGDNRYQMTGGDVFITQPGEIHSTGTEPENKGHMYWVQFRSIKEGSSFLGLTSQESHSLMRRFHSLRTHQFQNGELLTPTFERIFSAYDDKHNPLRIANLRNHLLRLALDIISIAEHQVTHPHLAGVQKAIRHIENNLATVPTVEQLARLAGMSESYFKIMFKKETGIPPVEYAMWRRMETAKQLLSTSRVPVTRLAVDLGFASSQHFATAFKRLTGLTPRAFRQRTVTARS
jgi:AraC-like DNA-binding protein